MALSGAVQAYLTELRLTGRSGKTVELQGFLLRALVNALSPSVTVSEISRTDLTQHLAALSERGLAQSYIVLNAKTIKRFFNWLCEQEEIERNPLQNFKISPAPDKPVPPLTDDESQRLVDAADTPMKRAVIMLLMDTGLRASELTGLKLGDIDLGAGIITVRGKGGKTRQLALNERPREALKGYLASRAQLDGVLWPANWNRKNLALLVDKVGKQAQVAPVYPHRFRHNWACRMRRAGVDILALQRLMGHSSLRTTLRYITWVEGEHAVEIHREHPLVG